MSSHSPAFDLHPLEIWTSRVLRAGVVAASVIILAGLAAFFGGRSGSGAPGTLNELLHSTSATVTLNGIVHGVLHVDTTAIIQAGVLALILTPVSRVAMSVLLFAAQRDITYVVITGTVLAVLALGLSGVVP